MRPTKLALADRIFIGGGDGFHSHQLQSNMSQDRSYKIIESLASVGIFNLAWYRRQYGLQSKDEELIHGFLHDPGCKRFSPSIYFNSEYYLFHNPDVEQEDINPLLHYLLHGELEGRRPNPLFDPFCYRRQLRERGINIEKGYLLAHYISSGAKVGIAPSAEFNPSTYLELNRDVMSAGLEPLAHYLEFGASEGRKLQPELVAATRKNLGDVAQAFHLLTRPNPARSWFPHGDLITNGQVGSHYPQCDTPFFSVVVPCWESQQEYLQLCLSSVLAQTWRDFELIVVDDGSKKRRNRELLQKLKKVGIKVVLREQNGGISAATNAGTAAASGKWLVLLDHDDLLDPSTLQVLQEQIVKSPGVQYLFSDAAKIDFNGDVTNYHYKPGWDPVLLYTYMYAGQVMCIQQTLWQQLGGLNSSFDGCQDHELALRVAAGGYRVLHIPQVLYYWRAIPGSTAMAASTKPYAHDAAKKAVQATLKQLGAQVKVNAVAWAAVSFANFFQLSFRHSGPDVCLVIPTRDNIAMLETLVSSIRKKTLYKNYEIQVMADDNVDAKIKKRLKALQAKVKFGNFADKNDNFSFSKKVNAGVKLATSPYVLLLNDDMEVVSPTWLSDMMGYAQMPNVAAVGAQLLYGDGSVQHAGITVGLEGGRVGHLFKGLPKEDHGYLSYRSASRSVFGVTAACMLIARDKYLEVGGFDETRFPLAYNDVDFCARLLQKGWRNIYAAQAVLFHYEGVTRKNMDRLPELLQFKAVYGAAVDPCRSPHWSLDSETISLLQTRDEQFAHGGRELLFVSHNAKLQGATKVLCELACRLASGTGKKPRLVIPDGPVGYPRIRKECEILRFNAPVTPSENSAALAAKILAAEQMLVRANPAVVVCNTLLNVLVVLAAVRRGIRVLWLIHESEGAAFFKAYDPLLMDYLLPQALVSASQVVFVSAASRAHYREFDVAGNFTVIRNGITCADPSVLRLSRTALRKKHGFGAREFLMLNVGTLCDRKAQMELVHLARHLEQKNLLLNARFLLIGPSYGDYKEKMQRAINTLGHYRTRFEFLEEVADPAPYYRLADLFVFTSKLEAYPTVLTESLAHGLPVLSTPVEGADDIVFHQDIGLVASTDNFDAWVEYILKMQEAGFRNRSSEAALAATNFLPQWGEVIQAYRRLLQLH